MLNKEWPDLDQQEGAYREADSGCVGITTGIIKDNNNSHLERLVRCLRLA